MESLRPSQARMLEALAVLALVPGVLLLAFGLGHGAAAFFAPILPVWVVAVVVAAVAFGWLVRRWFRAPGETSLREKIYALVLLAALVSSSIAAVVRF